MDHHNEQQKQWGRGGGKGCLHEKGAQDQEKQYF